MNDNLVPKIQSSLLVMRNLFITFSNDFELTNQYVHILPPQNNMEIMKTDPEYTDESVASTE